VTDRERAKKVLELTWIQPTEAAIQVLMASYANVRDDERRKVAARFRPGEAQKEN
jgi:hypothetical protein